MTHHAGQRGLLLDAGREVAPQRSVAPLHMLHVTRPPPPWAPLLRGPPPPWAPLLAHLSPPP